MKSCGVKRASADLQKCGFWEMKFLGVECRLVKLQRPPPEIRIFSPILRVCSMMATLWPRLAASHAQIMPAAPAPITITLKFGAFLSVMLSFRR